MKDLNNDTTTVSRSDEEEMFRKEVIKDDSELYFLDVYLQEICRCRG